MEVAKKDFRRNLKPGKFAEEPSTIPTAPAKSLSSEILSIAISLMIALITAAVIWQSFARSDGRWESEDLNDSIDFWIQNEIHEGNLPEGTDRSNITMSELPFRLYNLVLERERAYNEYKYCKLPLKILAILVASVIALYYIVEIVATVSLWRSFCRGRYDKLGITKEWLQKSIKAATMISENRETPLTEKEWLRTVYHYAVADEMPEWYQEKE